MTPRTTSKTYLNVPYKDKERVKARGARFDIAKKRWFIPEGVHLSPFLEWVQHKEGEFEKRLREAKQKYAERKNQNG